MKTKDMIATITAYSKGKPIQFRTRYLSGEKSSWFDCAKNSPCWDFGTNDYRAKPSVREPRSFLICEGEVCTKCSAGNLAKFSMCSSAFLVHEAVDNAS